MGETRYTLREIAEMNSVSAKTVQRLIKDHPELGIVMKPRTKTLVDFNQAAQVSALLGLKKSQDSEMNGDVVENRDISQKTETVSEVDKVAVLESATNFELVEELRAQILQLTERAARAEGQVEVLESQVRDLQSQRVEWSEERSRLQSDVASVRGLLETSELKAARSAAQAANLREGVSAVAQAGFFARGRMAKELSARANKMLLEDGE